MCFFIPICITSENKANVVAFEKGKQARKWLSEFGTEIQAGRWRVGVPIRSSILFLNLPNPSRRAMALGLTKPLTEMSTRNLFAGRGRAVHKAENLTDTCEPIV
jgi:hypothetical protein